jgi:exodeoxyribonuclease V alpha subunit
MVVIDEASMLDLVLANNLLKAIAPDTHLLLVGDIDQLPSVGAGDVLGDLIASEGGRYSPEHHLPAGRQFAHHQQRPPHQPGTPPRNRTIRPQWPTRRFYIFIKEDPDEAAELLVEVVQKRIPDKFGLDPLDDIQVLSPMYNGSMGVSNLNLLLQATSTRRAAKSKSGAWAGAFSARATR